MNLIGWLKERQNGETDEAFAARLDVSPALWSLLQSGKRQPTLWFVRKVLAAFPDEKAAIVAVTLDVECEAVAS